MKVMMKTLCAGPDGIVEPGAVVDVSQDQAQALIAGGYATC